jgi:hypothetical protein
MLGLTEQERRRLIECQREYNRRRAEMLKILEAQLAIDFKKPDQTESSRESLESAKNRL